MGETSKICEACETGIKGDRRDEFTWCSEYIAIDRTNHIINGYHDGYMKDDMMQSTIYHMVCWALIGKPTKFCGVSLWDERQGWGHSTRMPKTIEDVHSVVAREFVKDSVYDNSSVYRIVEEIRDVPPIEELIYDDGK